MTVAASRPSSTSSLPPFGSPSQPRNGSAGPLRPEALEGRSRPRAPSVVLADDRRGPEEVRGPQAQPGRDRLLRARRRPLAVHDLELVRAPARRLLEGPEAQAGRGRLRGPLDVEHVGVRPGTGRSSWRAWIRPISRWSVVTAATASRRVLAPQGVHVGCGAVEEDPADAGPGRVARDPLEAVGDARVDEERRRALPFAAWTKRKSCWICSTALSSAKRTSTSTPRRRPASRASSPWRAWYSWSALVRETTMRSAIGGDYRRSAPAERHRRTTGRRAARPPPRRAPDRDPGRAR